MLRLNTEDEEYAARRLLSVNAFIYAMFVVEMLLGEDVSLSEGVRLFREELVKEPD